MAARRREEKRRGYHRVAKVFDEHAAEYDSWFANSIVYAIELAALRSLRSKPCDPKLEVGVGPGHFARDLGIGFGIDPAAAPLRMALARGVRCCRGIGEELPIRDGSIGTVYLLLTLCFVMEPQKMVAECSRILKDGGCLVIGMIPAAGKWGKALAVKKEGEHVFYKHAQFHTVATVIRWLTAAGMRKVESRSTLYQPPGQVERMEESFPCLDEDAGFVVVVARKEHA